MIRILSALILAGSALLAGAESAPPATPPTLDLTGIDFTAVPEDRGVITPFAAAISDVGVDPYIIEQRQSLRLNLENLPAARQTDPKLLVSHLLCVAALADICRSSFEAEAPVMILELLKTRVPADTLTAILAGYARDAASITLITEVPALRYASSEDQVRERANIYAIKMLGRLLGRTGR